MNATDSETNHACMSCVNMTRAFLRKQEKNDWSDFTAVLVFFTVIYLVAVPTNLSMSSGTI